MARVTWKKADGSLEDYSFRSKVVLGRDDEADFIVDAKGVSRCHVLIEDRGGSYLLTDMGSTNGTLLNGRPLLKEARLRSGDRICIGNEVIEFADGGEISETNSSFATEPLSRTLAREGSPSASGYDTSNLPEVLPRKVGKFELEEKLGQGGMGAVYRVRDLDSGDEIAVNDVIVEIETAKSLVELPSPFAGTVGDLLVAEGDTVEVGAAIITIADAASGVDTTVGRSEHGEAAEAPEPDGSGSVLVGYGSGGPVQSRRRKPPVSAAERITSSVGVVAKPPIRKLARDLGVDLSAVTPTGAAGEVTRDDVVAHASQASVFRNIETPEI